MHTVLLIDNSSEAQIVWWIQLAWV